MLALGLTAAPAAVNVGLLTYFGRMNPIAEPVGFLFLALISITPAFEALAGLLVVVCDRSNRERWWVFMLWALVLNAVVYLAGWFAIVSHILRAWASV